MNDSLGDRMKYLESLTESRLMDRLPTIVRIDGRAFHTLTRGMKRPYDEKMSNAMIEVTKGLVKEFHACVGYTQSDEISLLFYQRELKSQLIFSGRIQKICSVLASYASAIFNRLQINSKIASFDARIFQVPNKSEAINYFIWHERDAIKNSISMAAQTVCSHKELINKNGSQQQEILFQKGINWNNYPAFFRRGSWIKFIKIRKQLSQEVLAKISGNIMNDGWIERSEVSMIEVEDLSKMKWQSKFLFSKYYK